MSYSDNLQLEKANLNDKINNIRTYFGPSQHPQNNMDCLIVAGRSDSIVGKKLLEKNYLVIYQKGKFRFF